MSGKNRRARRMMLFALIAALALPVRISAAPETESSAAAGTAQEISMDESRVSVAVGDTYKLNLKNLTGTETIVWTSSKPAVVAVNQRGRVRAKAAGESVITAEVDGVPYRCMVKAEEAASGIRLDRSELALVVDETYKLSAEFTEESPADSTLVWKSEDKKVVKVNSRGKMRAIGAGTARVIVQSKADSSIRAFCEVTVTEDVGVMRLSAATLSLKVGEKSQLTVTRDDDTALVWGTSDRSVAAVNQKGFVRGKKAGTAVVSVQRKGIGSPIYCHVTVTAAEAEEEPEDDGEVVVEEEEAEAPKASASAARLLSLLDKYSKQVQADKAAGIRWEYSNSAQNTWSKAYNASRKNKVTYVNCALTARWALREMGILDSANFWGVAGGGITFRGTSREQLLEHCEIIQVNKTPNELLAEGNLLPGDICTHVGYQHTNVYAGDNLWYDSGRNNAIGSYQDGTFVFDSFGPAATVSMDSDKIGYIIRIVR